MNPIPDPSTAYRLLADNIQRVIQGKPEVVRLAVVETDGGVAEQLRQRGRAGTFARCRRADGFERVTNG